MLHVHNEYFYLGGRKAQSRVGSQYFLGSRLLYLSKKPNNLLNNGPLHTKYQVLRHVVASAAED